MFRRTPSLRDRLAYQSFRTRMSADKPDVEIQKFLKACDQFSKLLQDQTNKFFNEKYDLGLLEEAISEKYGEDVDMGEAIIGTFEEEISKMVDKIKREVKSGKF